MPRIRKKSVEVKADDALDEAARIDHFISTMTESRKGNLWVEWYDGEIATLFTTPDGQHKWSVKTKADTITYPQHTFDSIEAAADSLLRELERRDRCQV